MTFRFTLRQMVVFIHVARLGTTVGTAARLAMSQSAVSAALAELESAVGEQLFDRNGRRLVLNDVGRRLLPSAIALVEQAEAMSRDFESDSITLEIAASSTIGNYVLPPILRQFMAVHPGANLKVIVGNTRDVARQVADFVADIGLIEGSCSDAGVRVEHWMDDEMIVVAPASGVGADHHQALASAQWLLREPGSGTREIFDKQLAPRLGGVSATLEIGNSEAIRRTLLNGFGVSCLSRHVVADDLASGRLVEIDTGLPPIHRPFSILLHRSKSPTRGIALFRSFLDAHRGADSPDF